jgi:hypothetical protein
MLLYYTGKMLKDEWSSTVCRGKAAMTGNTISIVRK